jgi:hypothetical protein
VRRALLAALVLASTGCGISHERDLGDASLLPTDASMPLPDAFVVRPDAFVVRPDAWIPFTPAPHGPLPVIPDQGGARISHPQLVVITYADDPNRASIEAHARWLVGSSWLATVGPEYGVGTGSILGIVERPELAPSTFSGPEIVALLRGGLDDHSLPAPTGPIEEALYLFYFPEWTTLSDVLLGTSCVSHGGYHNETTTSDGRPVSYAVLPTCSPFTASVTEIEQQQIAVTHEVIEAATDARPFTGPAFAFSQDAAVWSPWLIAGAEVADLCEYRTGASSFVRESGFVAARVWSNAVARLNDRDPCVPSNPAVSWGTLSVSPDAIQTLSAGGSTTFDVTAWTTQPMPALSIVAFPGTAGDGVFSPGVSLDRSSMNNGDHASLTVTVPFGTPGGQYGIAYLQVTYPSGDTDLVPIGLVSS